MSLLSVTDLSVSYRTRVGVSQVVHGVSFAVEPGEFVAVVGESGSGKSTTAHALIGLLADNGRLDSGSIVLGQSDITRWSEKRLRAVRGARIGLVPQDPTSSLDPVKTIGSQIGEVLRIHKRGDRRVVAARTLELLHRVGIDDPERRARQYPHELSGGMRQRVLIAIAIALEPQLIIADEATSALDVTVQRKILDLIDSLRAEFGMAVLLVTHDLAVAAERSERILVMAQGRIVEEGATAEVVANPRTDYARTLLSHAPSLAPPAFRPVVVGSYIRDPQVAADQLPYAVEASGLIKEFAIGRGGAFRAVDDVSFRIRRGTTHALVGESGSGKTTTARMIVRLERPSEGAIAIDGLDIARLAGEELRRLRRRVQLVYQNPFGSLDPRQTISQIVEEPLRNFSIGTRLERRARAAQLIDRVALPASTLSRSPRELSGGQRQRVAIARALAVGPETLVLDEAVSALDVTVQAQILALLDELQRDLGLTYLFISHDLSVVRQVSDTVSVMRSGRVVESGSLETVFTRPQHEYTKELLAAVPRPPVTIGAPR